MPTNTEKLLSEIRALCEEEKVRLLDEILSDLDTPDPAIEQIWAIEARKRWAAYKAGSV